MQFDKYEGLGNDFIVVEQDRPELPPQLVRRLCDRHFGIGADGVLVVSPSARAAATMSVLNADGSRPEMCGNGLRCVALHVARGRAEAAAQVGDELAIELETDAGVRRCSVTLNADLRAARVSSTLGRGEPRGAHRHPVDGGALVFERVAIGNPHAIVFDVELSPQQIDVLAPAVSAAIDGGANVEFALQRSPSELQVTVWERGVGRTLACGTGAGAVAVAAARAGRIAYDAPVTVQLPGGPLTLTVAESLEVQMAGPARHVFSGRVDVAPVERAAG